MALPGGYQTNAFDGEEGLALFTLSMAEMAHGGRSENMFLGNQISTGEPAEEPD
jgi:hypothetical protein